MLGAFHTIQRFTMNKKRTWSILLSFVVALTVLLAFGSTVMAEGETSGTCGENVTWSYEGTTLTISGTGDMANYDCPENWNYAPWFSIRTGIETVVIENGITGIGSAAFYNLSSLTSVSIPESVTKIGDKAFNDCRALPYVSFPSNLTSIGEQAFLNCEGITSVSIPDTVTTLGKSAFHNCRNLTSANIPVNLTVINASLFSGCDLTSVTIPSKVTSIGNYAFYSNDHLSSVTILGNVTSIGKEAFLESYELTSITLPDTVTAIGESAFYESGIKSIVLPEGVTTIESGTFAQCSQLTSITIPSTVTSIDGYAFGYNSALTDIYCYIEDPNVLADVYSEDKLGAATIHVPGNLLAAYQAQYPAMADNISGDIGEPVVIHSGTCGATGSNVTWELYSNGLLKFTGTGAVNDYSYSGAAPWHDYHNSIKSVIFSDGITNIGSDSFDYDYPNLETVSIPDSVTSIGAYAFYYCTNLTTANLSNNIKSVGNYAFYYCEKLNIPNFPNKIEVIGDHAFQKCLKLTAVTIPDSVTSLGNYAFYMCYNLESVQFPTPDKLQFTSIPKSCFDSCEKLEQVTIPLGITSIEADAFCSCSNLTSITIPEGVTTIGERAFSNCKKLETIDLPDSLESLGYATFCASGLKSIAIPSKVTAIPEYCFNASTIETIDIPASVQSIGEEAFAYCESLKSIVIPSSITVIPRAAFNFCVELESVNIPDTVTTIGDSAFYGCFKLKSVYVPSSVTSIGYSAFGIESTQDGKGLETIVLSEGLQTLGEYAISNTQIYSLNLPGTLTTIPSDSITQNTKLQLVTIGEGTEVLEAFAFRYSNNIKTVVIPSTVTEIRASVFGTSENLADVYLYSDPENISINTYGNFNENTKFHVPSQYYEGYLALLPDFANNIIGDADGGVHIDTGNGIHLYGYSLSLAGDVGVNFWMKLEAPYSANDNYMLFTVNGQTQKVKVSEASATGNPDYISFRCGVAAKEMSDTITAKFCLADGTEVGDEYSYSVREYANYILTHDSYSQSAKTLVKAMLNYGACSQKYFKYNTNSLANSILPEDQRYPGIASPNGIDYEVETPGCLKPQRVSLVLNSTVTLKLYFNTSEAEGKVFKLGDKVLRTSKSGVYTVVSIDSITALQLRTALTIDVYENDTNIGFVKYSPAKYCKIVLGLANDGTVTDDLKRVVSSLYYFSRAAENYNGNG